MWVGTVGQALGNRLESSWVHLLITHEAPPIRARLCKESVPEIPSSGQRHARGVVDNKVEAAGVRRIGAPVAIVAEHGPPMAGDRSGGSMHGAEAAGEDAGTQRLPYGHAGPRHPARERTLVLLIPPAVCKPPLESHTRLKREARHK